MESPHLSPNRSRLSVIAFTSVIGVGLMAVKFYAYYRTRSAAVLSDALESIINVVASGFALLSVVVSSKPPDHDHPYGHGKMEYFSAGFEGALVVMAATGIFRSAWGQFHHPQMIHDLGIGLVLVIFAGGVNLFLAIVLIKVGRRTHSLALVADGKHLMTDVWTSVAVVMGLFLVRVTGTVLLDALFAFGVGCHVLYSGLQLLRSSFSGLMDAADPLLLEEISRLLTRHRKDLWIDVHRLRAWRSGNRIFVDFHLILPRDLTLGEVHREVLEIERFFLEHYEGRAEVFVHPDPCTDPDCSVCARYRCAMRRWRSRQQNLWRSDTITGFHDEES